MDGALTETSTDNQRKDERKMKNVLTTERSNESFSFSIVCGAGWGVRRGERIKHEIGCEISFSNIDRELRGKAIEAAKAFKVTLKEIAVEDPTVINIPNLCEE